MLLYHGLDGGAHLEGAAARLALPLETLGLSAFAVISGFLLYRPFVAAINTGAPLPPLGRYFAARAMRVVPAYWFAITLIGLTVKLPGLFGPHWLAYYLFLGPLVDWSGPLQGPAAAWGLSVLVSFYLFLPAYAWARRRLGPGLLPDTVALSALGMGSLLLQGWYWHSGGALGRLNMTLATLLFPFALGMWISALAVRSRGVLSGRAAWCWPAAAAVYLLLCLGIGVPPLGAAIQDFSLLAWVGAVVFPALVVALVILPMVLSTHPSGVPRLLMESPLLVLLGRFSYGIFLWYPVSQGRLHFAGFFAGRRYEDAILFLAATVVVTLPPALLSYLVVERPFEGLRGRRRLAAAGLVAAPPKRREQGYRGAAGQEQG